MDMQESMMGRGRDAIEMIVDAGSFAEGTVGAQSFDDPEFGPGAVVGTATLQGTVCTIIASDGGAMNEKFPVVYAGIIGLEEGYKMPRRSMPRSSRMPKSRGPKNGRWC